MCCHVNINTAHNFSTIPNHYISNNFIDSKKPFLSLENQSQITHYQYKNIK